MTAADAPWSAYAPRLLLFAVVVLIAAYLLAWYIDR